MHLRSTIFASGLALGAMCAVPASAQKGRDA